MTILNLKNISKNFGAIVALDGVSLDLKEGEVLGLMGDNGAGKSTLIKIIAGNFKQSDGEMLFEDQNVEFNKPMDARNKGIEVVYQDLALCDNLTAASNIFLTREPKKKIGPFRLIDFTKMFEKAKQLFAELKSETLPNETVRMMSGGQRQAVALARTKLSKAKVVLLDEPTAAISVRQVAEVLELIRQLKKQGISVDKLWDPTKVWVAEDHFVPSAEKMSAENIVKLTNLIQRKEQWKMIYQPKCL